MDMPDEATLSVGLIHPHGLQVRNVPLNEAKTSRFTISRLLSYIIIHVPPFNYPAYARMYIHRNLVEPLC